MSAVKKLLNEFTNIAQNPKGQMQKYLRDGHRVIGYVPPYTPRPLLEATGCIPMGLWGGQISPVKAGRYVPISTCSIMRSVLELGMNGTFDNLSAVVMPILCDTLRGMSNLWRVGVPNIAFVPYIYPQNRKDVMARAMLEEELYSVAQRLEKILDISIDDRIVSQKMADANRHNELIRKFTSVANNHLDIITPLCRHNIMKSAHFMTNAAHSSMIEKLIELLERLPIYVWKGKKLILSGITCEPDDLLEIMERESIAVVGDDLAHESRQYRADYAALGTSFKSLAGQWFSFHGCPTVHNENNKYRGEFLVSLARETDADGVAICLMQFCDVEEYEYPYLSKMIEEAGLTCLCIEIDQSTKVREQSRTLLQCFSEL